MSFLHNPLLSTIVNPPSSLTNMFLAFLIIVPIIYCILLAIYRLYSHPLAHIPGPRLAALTFWYEFYYDVVKPGRYVFKIEELHEQYGRSEFSFSHLSRCKAKKYPRSFSILSNTVLSHRKLPASTQIPSPSILNPRRSHPPNHPPRNPHRRPILPSRNLPPCLFDHPNPQQRPSTNPRPRRRPIHQRHNLTLPPPPPPRRPRPIFQPFNCLQLHFPHHPQN